MENNEYGKLVDFLGKKFEEMDDRFDQMDKKFDQMDNKIEQMDKKFEQKLEDQGRHNGILIEEVNHKIDLVIEGQQGIIQKFGRHVEENESEHKRLEHMIMEDRADVYNLKKRLP
jgi:hypothetical protein